MYSTKKKKIEIVYSINFIYRDSNWVETRIRSDAFCLKIWTIPTNNVYLSQPFHLYLHAQNTDKGTQTYKYIIMHHSFPPSFNLVEMKRWNNQKQFILMDIQFSSILLFLAGNSLFHRQLQMQIIQCKSFQFIPLKVLLDHRLILDFLRLKRLALQNENVLLVLFFNLHCVCFGFVTVELLLLSPFPPCKFLILLH